MLFLSNSCASCEGWRVRRGDRAAGVRTNKRKSAVGSQHWHFHLLSSRTPVRYLLSPHQIPISSFALRSSLSSTQGGDGKSARTVPTGGRCFYRTIECPANAGAAGGDMKEQIKTGRRRKDKSLICKVYPTIIAPSALHLQADLYQTTLEKLIQESSPSSQLFKNSQLPTDFTFFTQHYL